MSRPARAEDQPARTGKAAFGDWTTDAPGVRRKSPSPIFRRRSPPESAGNFPRSYGPLQARYRKVPLGFKVERFASGLRDPRLLRVRAQRRHLHRRELRESNSSHAAPPMVPASPSAPRFSPRDWTSRSASHSGRPARIRSSSISATPAPSFDSLTRPAIFVREVRGNHRSEYSRRRPFDRRRSLDARRGFFARWFEDVRLGRIEFE